MCALLSVLLAGCTAPGPDGDGSGDALSRAPTGSSRVLVTTGIRYAATSPGWADATLDLYLPSDTPGAPLSVVVPDAGAEPAAPEYADLARDLAARGVSAAVVRWGVQRQDLTTLAGRPVQALVAQTRSTAAEVSCALRVAAAKAGAGGGAPATPLVVVGHGAGANAAAMAVLASAAPFPTCFDDGDAPGVVAAVLWDGDWLAGLADDVLGAGTHPFVTAYSPWPSVDTLHTSTYVELGVNANRLEGRSVPASPTSSYLTTRDPSGTMTRDLEQVRAFDDGSLDPVDVTRGFEVGLRDAGVQTREQELHGEGDPDTLGSRARALVVQSVVELTRP